MPQVLSFFARYFRTMSPGLLRAQLCTSRQPGANAAAKMMHISPADVQPATQLSELATHQLGQVEGQIERLARIQARIAEGLIGLFELLFRQLLAAAEALGNIAARDLQVHAARPGAFRAVGGEEALDLGHDVAEATCLATALGCEGVGVHRIADPDDRVTG